MGFPFEQEGDFLSDLVQRLKRAQKGDDDAMMSIVEEFMPLISKYSRDASNKIDEDCKQILTEAFVKAVQRFNIRY